jgi:peptidoglycan/LPS O-acetylase OafA/YrhL
MSINKAPSSDGFKLAAIDALRGWAILLVIIVHTAGPIHELPWPVKKLTNMGWYGVQLFFIMSAFTLLMSWQRQTHLDYNEKCLKFLIRRFFRIAPMYYTGAIIYFIIRPPGELFCLEQLIINLTFMNSWSPKTMPTVDYSWQVVPGGWSIGVEFCFYFLFPVLAKFCSCSRRSLFFLIISLAIGSLSYYYGMGYYESLYDNQAADNFLFFWMPNQVFVFALGFLLYYSNINQQQSYWTYTESNNSSILLILLLLSLILISQINISKHFSTTLPFIPKHYIVSCIFALISLIIINSGNKFFVNRFIIKLGQVSFSAYVLHFAVIQFFMTSEVIRYSGYESIFWCIILIVIVTQITFLASIITYNFIEKPFINLSRTINKAI